MQVGKAKVTVILHFKNPILEERFEAVECKRRAVPNYMKYLHEEIIEIKFEHSKCYKAIYNAMIDYAQKMPQCYIFFEYDNGKIDITFADVQDYYPTSLAVIGEIKKATMEEIEKFRVVPPKEIERRKLEEAAYKNFMEDPELERFRLIDLED